MVKQKSKEILIGTGNMTESLEKKEDSSEDEVVKAEKQVINIDGKKGNGETKKEKVGKSRKSGKRNEGQRQEDQA